MQRHSLHLPLATLPSSPFEGNLVHEAMAFVEDKRAYLQAVQQCPDLVRSESPHEMFMEFCCDDMWEAAKRLAAFWRLKLELFGTARAFLPVSHAITEHDWQILGRCNKVVCPPDAFGSAVVFIDGTRDRKADEIGSADTRCRLFWFLATTAIRTNYERYNNSKSENSTQQALSQKQRRRRRRPRWGNVVYLYRLSCDTFYYKKSARSTANFVRRAFHTALCGQIVAMHFCAPYSPVSAQASVFEVVFRRFTRDVSKWINELVPSKTHTGTLEEIILKLEQLGLKSESVPTRLGGSWNASVEWPAFLEKHDLSPPEEIVVAGTRAMTPYGRAASNVLRNPVFALDPLVLNGGGCLEPLDIDAEPSIKQQPVHLRESPLLDLEPLPIHVKKPRPALKHQPPELREPLLLDLEPRPIDVEIPAATTFNLESRRICSESEAEPIIAQHPLAMHKQRPLAESLESSPLLDLEPLPVDTRIDLSKITEDLWASIGWLAGEGLRASPSQPLLPSLITLPTNTEEVQFTKIAPATTAEESGGTCLLHPRNVAEAPTQLRNSSALSAAHVCSSSYLIRHAEGLHAKLLASNLSKRHDKRRATAAPAQDNTKHGERSGSPHRLINVDNLQESATPPQQPEVSEEATEEKVRMIMELRRMKRNHKQRGYYRKLAEDKQKK